MVSDLPVGFKRKSISAGNGRAVWLLLRWGGIEGDSVRSYKILVCLVLTILELTRTSSRFVEKPQILYVEL